MFKASFSCCTTIEGVQNLVACQRRDKAKDRAIRCSLRQRSRQSMRLRVKYAKQDCCLRRAQVNIKLEPFDYQSDLDCSRCRKPCSQNQSADQVVLHKTRQVTPPAMHISTPQVCWLHPCQLSVRETILHSNVGTQRVYDFSTSFQSPKRPYFYRNVHRNRLRNVTQTAPT